MTIQPGHSRAAESNSTSRTFFVGVRTIGRVAHVGAADLLHLRIHAGPAEQKGEKASLRQSHHSGVDVAPAQANTRDGRTKQDTPMLSV